MYWHAADGSFCNPFKQISVTRTAFCKTVHCLLQEDHASEYPSIYIGKFRKGLRHGLGAEKYRNGEEYFGEFDSGMAAGYGVADLGSTAGIYEGEWKAGVRHGWAVSTLCNKAMWAGKAV